MPEWTTACPDWADRLRTGRSIIPPPIFPEEAEANLEVMRDLRIVDAPGSPRIGDSCGEWVFDLAASVFGAYDASSGRRLITEWFVMLPKKNFKSGLAASIMLTSLIRNWRQSAEFTILAPTKEVADNSFNPARDMVQYKDEDDESELLDLIHVQEHIKTMKHRGKNATLRVLATDSATVTGKKSVGTLVEELWLFGKQAGAKDMFREALGGLASRPEGFVIWITTQSDEPPAGIFKEKLQYARDVRDGKIHDPQFVPIIYEHPPELIASKQHLKLENLPMVNPNFGYSVDSVFLEREHRKAVLEGEGSLRGFLSKHGNVEIGLNLRSDRWAGADFWLAAGDANVRLDYLLVHCEVIVVGIDGGGLDDLLGLTLVGRERGTGRWLTWSHAWAHEIALERRPEIAPALRDFEKQGDLTIVDLPGKDVIGVADIVCRVQLARLLPDENAIGVDAAGITDIVDELISEGRAIEMKQIVAISQGWKLNASIKTTERAVAGGELLHGAQPIMAWCVGNARTEDRGNAISVTKQVSGKAKIDPLMALFNAVSLMALKPKAVESAYNRRGILMF
jgi:phage terminase large subunit-like protein